MIGLLIILSLLSLVILIGLTSGEKKINPIAEPNISIGSSITYPEDLSCEHCGNGEFNFRRDIDTETWDMICPECDEIAYKHPKRDERQEQIQNMLNN